MLGQQARAQRGHVHDLPVDHHAAAEGQLDRVQPVDEVVAEPGHRELRRRRREPRGRRRPHVVGCQVEGHRDAGALERALERPQRAPGTPQHRDVLRRHAVLDEACDLVDDELLLRRAVDDVQHGVAAVAARRDHRLVLAADRVGDLDDARARAEVLHELDARPRRVGHQAEDEVAARAAERVDRLPWVTDHHDVRRAQHARELERSS